MTRRGEQTQRRYAESTEVPAEKSQQEVEKLLKRYGATKFARGWGEGGRHALIGFEMTGRQIRILLPFPAEEEFAYSTGHWRRTEKQRREAWDQEVRRRWRALLLVLKAQLEAVASSILTVEEIFLPWIVLENGQTVAEFYGPQLEASYGRGQIPPMLPGLVDPPKELP